MHTKPISHISHSRRTQNPNSRANSPRIRTPNLSWNSISLFRLVNRSASTRACAFFENVSWPVYLAKLKPTRSRRLKQGDILDHAKYRGSTSREINIDPPNFTSGDDMEAQRMSYRSKRTLKVLVIKSSATAQPAVEPAMNPPTQPPSLKLSEPLEPLVRQPPMLSSSTQVPQPHRPITPVLSPSTQVPQPHRPITPVLSPST
ncbi:hypothetical protein Cgig2_020460 [Carnegiea gigantea]|uniref:Uncharacterized protein n=1 Tax=Carnegiea gigantea TaxID=171969 RepID=A0A9Q1JV53_9CARY|nr:hypothetical protein Cgig2_020460 [Carnegiea gigantea]